MKKTIYYALQILFFIAIFMAVEYWQTRNLLDDTGKILAPNFSLVDTNGTVINLKNLPKQPTVIYFFAPWCKICHYSIPNLQILRDITPESELNIIVIALDWQSKEEVVQYMKAHELTMPVLLGTVETMKEYKIEAFPTYYVLNPERLITKVSMGYSTEIGLRLNTP